MKREDLIKNSGYWISKIQIDLFNQLSEYMKAHNLNKSQLAKKLGVSKGYISQIINGDFNHKISTLVELSLAMEKIPELKFTELSQLIDEEQQGIKRVSWSVKIKKSVDMTSELNVQTDSIENNTNFKALTTIDQKLVNFS